MAKLARNSEEVIKATVEEIMPKIFEWLHFESFHFKTEEEKANYIIQMKEDLVSALDYDDAYQICKSLDEWEPDEFLFEIMQEANRIKSRIQLSHLVASNLNK